MSIAARYYTDPSCPWSWSAEPVLRRLMVEFGDNLSWTYVMGGLARDYTKSPGGPDALLAHWLDVADRGRMPIDPRLWREGPIASSYPACIAVKAAAEQASDGGYRYLRLVREGLMCFRRKLDGVEALVEEARRAGLDVERFRVDAGSNAMVEAFGNDLEEVRHPPPEARAAGAVRDAAGERERFSFPSVAFGGGRSFASLTAPYDELRAAAIAGGAEPVGGPLPSVEEALRRFGTMATAEVAEVCGLTGPRAPAELWRLASEWRVRPVRVVTGELWEAA
jgi:predicted DsbA family dithiol-disulfide isomerase